MIKDEVTRVPKFSHSVLYNFGCCTTDVYPVDSPETFVELSKKGNLIPLHRCIFSDHLTPVLAYRCLVKEDDRDAPSFLFESVEPGLQVSNVVSSSKLSFFSLLYKLPIVVCRLLIRRFF